MKTLMVGYDLNKSGQNYDKADRCAEEQLRDLVAPSRFDLADQDLETCVQVRDELLTLIDSNDELLVAELTGVAAWYGIKESGSSWLTNNL